MITYTIVMLAPHTHLYDVTIDVDELRGDFTDVVLPAWTPGSYMIRDFARHVQEFASASPWQKIAKDTWRVQHGAAEKLTVRYRVYAFDLTVRTSHLDSSHGYFNGANVCMYVPGRTQEPLALRLVMPEGWVATTALPLAAFEDQESEVRSQETGDSGTACHFTATGYDELIDSPFECGTHRLLAFDVDGIAHRIAIWGYGNEDENRLVDDTRRIVEVQRDLFGSLPYPHYTIILHLTDGRGGGLEHRNSVTNMLDRWTFRPERSYERYLALTSHELFHVWNVKRLRAAALGPFDYQRENYTRLLWVMEGFTNYYDELLLVRGGLLTPERYLERLADEIVVLQSQPGRLVQSLETSSFDAWIKLYRPDENSSNSSISYYLKGGLVAMLIDFEIRRRTVGARALDDVLRLLYARYPFDGPGTPRSGCYPGSGDGGCGRRLERVFAQYVSGVDEIDYDAGFAVVGLTLRWSHRSQRSESAPAWLGLKFKRQGERTLVAEARSDGPAYAGGIYTDDELLALDGWRVNEEKLNARLAERAPGDSVTLTVFRGDSLQQIVVTLAAAPFDRLELVKRDDIDAQAQANYRSWLGV
ncbi:M61 family metallopeptidase [Candidatus Gracilibacteria bacterium]|nr:M61 family metallopeptidase [Candidatus Gracilibacteria bacterium]